MRTWQELLDAARATGTYDDYVGDGFTVPWQTGLEVNPFLGLGLLAYKSWLDQNYFPASKLHDWLYTPYGSLISVTRDEADAALRDYMRAIGGSQAERDSALVFAAVTLGGGPFFGNSQTGFDQGRYLVARQTVDGIVSGPNMPPAGRVTVIRAGIGDAVYFVGDPAMSIKVVMIFQQTTDAGGSDPAIGLAGRQHIAGWTEHVWWASDSVDQLMQALTQPFAGHGALLLQRATLLTTNAAILGVRLYKGGAGKGQFRSLAYPGQRGSADIPQMALLCTIALANNTAARRMVLRGIPDNVVIGGEFVPDPAYSVAIQQFGEALQNFGAVAGDAVTSYPIFSVDANGLVTLNGVNNPFAVGNVITFRNTVSDLTGNRLGGQFVLSTIGPMNNQFTVTGWTFGPCSGGDCRQPTSSIYGFSPTGIRVSRIVTRKVGRPFELYRGRRSKRRARA